MDIEVGIMLKKTLDTKPEAQRVAHTSPSFMQAVAEQSSAPVQRGGRPKGVEASSVVRESAERVLSSLRSEQGISDAGALESRPASAAIVSRFQEKHEAGTSAMAGAKRTHEQASSAASKYAPKNTENMTQDLDIAAEVRAAKTKAAAMLAARTLVKSEPVSTQSSRTQATSTQATSAQASSAQGTSAQATSAQGTYAAAQRTVAETLPRAKNTSPVPSASENAKREQKENPQGSQRNKGQSSPTRSPIERKKTERSPGNYSAEEKIKFLADVQKAESALRTATEESLKQVKNTATIHKQSTKEIVTPLKNDDSMDSNVPHARMDGRVNTKSDNTHFSQESVKNTMSSVPIEKAKREYPPKNDSEKETVSAAVKTFTPVKETANTVAAAPPDKDTNMPRTIREAELKQSKVAPQVAKQTPITPASSKKAEEVSQDALKTPKSQGKISPMTPAQEKAKNVAAASEASGEKPVNAPAPKMQHTAPERGTDAGVPLGSQNQAPADSIPDVPPMPVAPSEVDFIPPLLRSLSSLLRLRGKSISPQFLYAGLAGVGEVTPGECMRAAGRAGLQARIIHRPLLEDISPMTLPCILLLQGNRSCLLTALSHNVATVIFPEMGEDPQQVSQESILREYTGYAVFGSVEKQPDKRIDTFRRPQGKRWFWDAIKHYGPIYRHAAFASVIINLIALGSPLFVMNVYDRVVPNNAIDTLWVLALGVTIAYFFDFLLRTLRNHFVDTAGRNADVVISSMLVDKVLSMQLDHKPESTGALVNNVREFESLREFFSSSTLLSCIDLPFLFLFVLCLSFIGGPLVILPLVAMPIMFGAGLILQALAKRAAEKSYSQNMHKNALLTEIVNGLETLKCCQGENRMQRMWEGVVENSAQANIETKKYGSLAVGFSVFITQFVTVGMVVWGVHLIAAGELTMGGLIGSNILAGRAMAPLMQMAGLITRYQNSRISLDALNMLMALPSEDRQEQATVDFGPLEASFTFENVAFSYPGVARTAVEGLSLKINHGEKIGVIGRMGSGKSTLIRLLIGLYQPKEGAVKFGGVDLRQLAGADLRSRVGFAPQDTVLFYGTVRDNIVLGDPYINDQRMIRAASLAGVTDFIRTNPEGFGAQVGEQGRALSGGQRQAIGLARSLVRDPEVLILDEPTSNMDTSSEQAVQARLHKIIKDKTLILVTHRMSMLRLVDRLIVMDGGRIVADGPKDAVIQKLRASSPTNPKKKGDEIAA